MKIIIVGCGRVGQTLAEKLNDDGNDVTVVDISSEKVRAITSRYDVMGIVGNGATHAVQSEAGIEEADLFIAVTDSDELNLLCCMIAKRSGKCQTVARIKSPEYSNETEYLKKELGLAMVINPEYAAAEEIARVLRFPSAVNIERFGKGKVELIKFKLQRDNLLIGLSIKDAVMRLKSDVLVCTVERGEDAYIPKGDFVFLEKDLVSIIATPKAAKEFFSKIHLNGNTVKRAMVAGGGDISHYLCDILEKSDISVKIIEKDRKRCEELCTLWKNVDVISGDSADRQLLLEEGLSETDAFVALASFDEENILLSLFAKEHGVEKLVTKINRIDYDSVISKLDLDTMICPKNITSDIILRYVRARKNAKGSNIETLYNIIQDKVEAAEFVIKAGSPVIGVPLYALNFKPNVLVASIVRANEVIIPRGYDMITEGDSVIVITGDLEMLDIADVLADGHQKPADNGGRV